MSRSSRARKTETRSGWWKQNLPIVKFIGLFLGLLAAFQLAYYELVVPSDFFKAYLGANTHVAAIILRAIGETLVVFDDQMSSTFSMSVKTGCDGLQAMAILVIAILVFPGGGWKTLYAAIGGVALIGFLNVLRIVTLFWTGVHRPEMFQLLHVHVWPAFLIIVALAYSIAWSARASRAQARA